MNNRSNSPALDRILRAGLVTPALALTIIAGAAFAQQGGMGGRVYEVIIESQDRENEAQHDQRADEERRASERAESRGRAIGRARADEQDGGNAKVVVEINRIVDGKEISVRRVNSEPIVVKVDGKVISVDHYDVENSVVIIRDPKTGKTHHVRMPSMDQNNLRVGAFPAPAGAAAPRATGLNMPSQWSRGAASPSSSQPRVMLGVVMAQPDPVVLEHLGLDASKAVVLERVVDGLPADKAGLQVKDIIVGFGDKAEPRSADDIRKVLAKAEPGKVVKLKVIRKGEPIKLELKLEAFDAAALGRAPLPGMASDASAGREGQAARWERLDDLHARMRGGDAVDRQEHLARAHQAMEEAAEVLARMEIEVGEHAEHARHQASEAIRQAIEAMQQGDLAGMEIEEMRQFQQEAVERLRRDLADNQNVQRFWAEGVPGREGFALTFPGVQERASDEWAQRLEQLESRLNELEQSVERAMDRLEDRTEAMMERLIERLERVIERDEDEEHRRGR